ncbi:MAG: putative hydrolase or acyltransferase of alpha/beta superfamily, partial [Frankiales bacterium]|nr:putative hydrolase or acyltransferase of alpha/beta superfamily [Frankiales bacterium]
TTYVACAEDRLVNPAWSRTTAVELLSADLVELPGGHSPFLSRPGALAAALQEVASG